MRKTRRRVFVLRFIIDLFRQIKSSYKRKINKYNFFLLDIQMLLLQSL